MNTTINMKEGDKTGYRRINELVDPLTTAAVNYQEKCLNVPKTVPKEHLLRKFFGYHRKKNEECLKATKEFNDVTKNTFIQIIENLENSQ